MARRGQRHAEPRPPGSPPPLGELSCDDFVHMLGTPYAYGCLIHVALTLAVLALVVLARSPPRPSTLAAIRTKAGYLTLSPAADLVLPPRPARRPHGSRAMWPHSSHDLAVRSCVARTISRISGCGISG